MSQDHSPPPSPQTQPSPASGHARLIIMTGNDLGRTFTIDGTGVVIGRASDAKIHLLTKDISRYHAKITQNSEGRWIIKDLGSSNGTYVNGLSVTQTDLSFGDRVQIGDSALFIFARHDQVDQKILQLQKMEAIGQLASGIAHDFNNLLTVIQSNLDYLSLLADEDGPWDPVEIKECLGDTQQVTKRASALTRQLLGFSRKVDHLDSKVNLDKLAQEVIRFCQQTFDPDTKLSLEGSAELWVRGDEDQLHQVMMNLMINARDAMPEGGKIVISLSEEQLPAVADASEILSPTGRSAVIRVKDEGVGMDDKTCSLIFEPFFTTKGRGEGTGLGLATVFNVVKKHGGDIQVMSTLGQGTTFLVYLPCIDARQEEAPITPPAPTIHNSYDQESMTIRRPRTSGQPRCILVVDDEEHVMESSRRLLESWQHRVLIAQNGREAIDIFERERDLVDLVILDMVMPDLGGQETFRILRMIDPDVQVILTSGQVDNASVQGLLKAGAVGFLPKPHGAEELRAALTKVLGK